MFVFIDDNEVIIADYKKHRLKEVSSDRMKKICLNKGNSRSSNEDFTVGRILLGQALNLLDIRDISIATDYKGRVKLPIGLHASISHSENYVAVFVSSRRSVGIDIEEIVDQGTAEGLSEVVFSDRELRDLDSAFVTATFSIKEAIYKKYSEKELGFQDINIVDLSFVEKRFSAKILDEDFITGYIQNFNDEFVISIANELKLEEVFL